MLTVVTAATVEPVTLVEAKAHLRVIHTSDDTMIGALLTAARETIEQNTGRALAAASYLWAASDCWQVLPLFPASAITAATYIDGNDTRVALPDYTFDANRGRITLDENAVLEGDQVNIEFDTAPTIIIAALKAAILLQLSDLYESPSEPQNEKAIARLITPHRVNFGV